MKRDGLTSRTYLEFLNSIKSKIHQARFQAAKAVNKELIALYWQIGEEISERQEKFGWGKAIVEKLGQDLMQAFPKVTGFSARNLWDMRRFYQEYAQYPNLRQVVAEIPWGHHLVILNKVKEIDAREYYLQAIMQCGWSRNILLHQINAKAFERQRLLPKQHNFKKTLPNPLADQAEQTMKDIYALDFLGITGQVVEKEVGGGWSIRSKMYCWNWVMVFLSWETNTK